jgi:hypothetical protein
MIRTIPFILPSTLGGYTTMARLTNTYQQYKADTKLFASWLATTAKANGWYEPGPSQADSCVPPEPPHNTEVDSQVGAGENQRAAERRRRRRRATLPMQKAQLQKVA